MPPIISRGAESVIFEDQGKIIKKRLRKNYRIAELDERLRKTRTRSEAHLLQKLHQQGFPVPAIYEDDEQQTIIMEQIEGKRVRDILTAKNCPVLCQELGKLIKQLHSLGIIHGDLTTSNILYAKSKLYFIDFGLSYYSHKLEDKAVDLHLLRQALESKHYTIWKKAFAAVLKTYHDQDVEQRLSLVEARGRNSKHHK